MSEGEKSTTIHVAADAQFGGIKVLLPFVDFEDVYQAVGGDHMIGFPGGLDDLVASTGYHPRLHKAVAVPMGSRVSIGIPICEEDDADVALYRYFIVWRDRNLTDFRNPPARTQRKTYHYAKQGLGAVDGSLAGNPQLFPRDARLNSIGYSQSEDTGVAGVGTVHIYPEALIPHTLFRIQALTPAGAAAAIQQGIYDPDFVPDAHEPMRYSYQCDAGGDEMIIFAQKIPDDQGVFAAWDFDGVDAAFSNIYGRGGFAAATHDIFADGGIRFNTGTNP